MDEKSKLKDAVLVLEDGHVFYGTGFGKTGTATGEICFNTGMTGYQEVFTDPSYYGQIVIMNSVHVGNYGTLDEEVESNSYNVTGLGITTAADIAYATKLLAGGSTNFTSCR